MNTQDPYVDENSEIITSFDMQKNEDKINSNQIDTEVTKQDVVSEENSDIATDSDEKTVESDVD